MQARYPTRYSRICQRTTEDQDSYYDALQSELHPAELLSAAMHWDGSIGLGLYQFWNTANNGQRTPPFSGLDATKRWHVSEQ